MTEFDKIIKHRLENISVDYQPAHWELMNQQLTAATMPETDAFDEVLREKIMPLENGAMMSAHWAMMDNLLDKTNMNDPIDELVQEKIQTNEIPYQPAHWQLMEQRLEETFSWQNRLIRYKVAEVSLMLLSIFTIIHLMPIYQQGDADNNNTPQNTLPAATPTFERFHPTTPAQGIRPNLTPHKQPNTVQVPIAAATIKSNKRLIGSNGSDEVIHNFKQNYNINVNNGQVVENENIIDENIAKIENLSTLNDVNNEVIHIENSAQNLVIENILTPTVSSESRVQYTPLEVLPTLGQSGLLPMNISNPSPSLLLTNMVYKPTKLKSFQIGLFGNLDMDYVQSPSVFDKNQIIRANWSPSKSFGVETGLKIGDLNIRSGLAYSTKSYDQDVTFRWGSVFSGFFKENLNRVNLRILQVPLTFGYDFAHHHNSNLYFNIGAALNLVTQAQYQTKVKELSNGSTLVPAIDVPSDRPIFTEGLFEGGLFTYNHFYTVNAAVGYEHAISNRWDLFTEALYQHTIRRRTASYDNDVINTTSLRLGVRNRF